MKTSSFCFFCFTLFFAIGCSHSDRKADDLANLPEEQKQFCRIIAQEGAGDSLSQKNLADLNALLAPSGKFSAWLGRGSVHSEDGKNLGVTFTPACPDGHSLTLEEASSVPVDSPVGHVLQASDFSQGMIVSGKLVENSGALAAQFQLFSPARLNQQGNVSTTSASAQSRKPSPASTHPASSNRSSNGQPAHATPSSSGNGLTDQQKQLCQLYNDFYSWRPPPPETNPIKAAQAPPIKEPDWDARLASILGDGAFINWKGKLTHFLPNGYQEISVEVTFGCPGTASSSTGTNWITLGTVEVDRDAWEHRRSKFPPTDPKLGSEISNFLSTANLRDPVTVSGQIFYGSRYYDRPMLVAVYYPTGRLTGNAISGFAVRFSKMSR